MVLDLLSKLSSQNIILASASPRRREILQRVGLNVKVSPWQVAHGFVETAQIKMRCGGLVLTANACKNVYSCGLRRSCLPHSRRTWTKAVSRVLRSTPVRQQSARPGRLPLGSGKEHRSLISSLEQILWWSSMVTSLRSQVMP